MKMFNLTRENVANKFDEIVEKYGKPRNGRIFCVDQLIAKIVKELSTCRRVTIIYENGMFSVDTASIVKSEYTNDYVYVGDVIAEEWFSKEQLLALHELAFGYQF